MLPLSNPHEVETEVNVTETELEVATDVLELAVQPFDETVSV